jgi:hypothetical protein
MQIRETTLLFPLIRGSGPQLATQTLLFPREVTSAVAVLRGYQIGFGGKDHEVGLLEVALETSINQNSVTVEGRLACRDWSGSWDDNYGGSIQVSVLVELASASEPLPRGDLTLLDAETNQAIQYFRSAEHLDPSNVRPDNSIPLVAGKATGIRIYVDYDASAGLPPIPSLSGELVATSGGATLTTLPFSSILPRRGTEIDRGLADHTLNFSLPASWCHGLVDITVRAFDEAAPTQKSAALKRTLRFLRVDPLRVYAVGVNYTGAGMNLPAPVQADFASTFDFARKVWPTGEVFFSGYTTIEFSDDLSGAISSGCGSGFSALLDDLQDLKGDTDDIVYGLLPASTPLTEVGGCGAGGAGAGREGDIVAAAHESGHAVGRDHAPCDDFTRCNSPRNPDENYPRYGNYITDSIGEFGYDPDDNSVLDPAAWSDFMGYSPASWISPYTYTALMALGHPSPAPASYAARSISRDGPRTRPGDEVRTTGEWLRRREQVLFLRLRADGTDVQVRPSFTYDAFRRATGMNTEYDVHVLGQDKVVLACVPLERRCGPCATGCGPVELRADVPLVGRPHFLVVRREGQDLATFEFEDPVDLDCKSSRTPGGDIEVSWEASGDADSTWYLVQWRDQDGAWRGVAPRTQARSLVVGKRHAYASKGKIRLRVLAVRSLTTSACELEVDAERDSPPISITPYEIKGGLAVLAADPLGRQVPSQEITWYDDKGGEVGRGSRVRPTNLAAKFLRAVSFARGVSVSEAVFALGDRTTPPKGSDKPRTARPKARGTTRKGRDDANKAG